jgi:hypothetical protein
MTQSTFSIKNAFFVLIILASQCLSSNNFLKTSATTSCNNNAKIAWDKGTTSGNTLTNVKFKVQSNLSANSEFTIKVE